MCVSALLYPEDAISLLSITTSGSYDLFPSCSVYISKPCGERFEKEIPFSAPEEFFSVGLCVNYYLLQEQTSLMRTEMH